MKPAPPAASKPHMLTINRAIIPNHANPHKNDCWGVDDVDLVVITDSANPIVDRVCAFRGTIVTVPGGTFEALVASARLRPLGRLERRDGVKPRPEDFDLAAAVNDLGPRLRALREQTGLRIGEFARALGCPLPALSRIELGEWVDQHPDLVGLSEVREDDVVAMAREAVVAFQAGQDFYITKKAIARGEYEMTMTLRLAAPSTEP